MARRYHRVGLLGASFLWKLTLCLLLVFREGTFRSASVQGSLVSLKCMVSSAMRIYLLCLGGNQGQQQLAVCFGTFMDSPGQQLKRGLLMSDFVALLGGVWLLDGVLSAQMRKVHLNYIHMFYTQNYVYYRVFRINNSMIPCGFVRHPYCFTYSFILLCLSPCPFPKEPPSPIPHQIICILLFPFTPYLLYLPPSVPLKSTPSFPLLLTDHLCPTIPFSIAPQAPIRQGPSGLSWFL